MITSASDPQSLNVLLNVAQSGLSTIGLILSATNMQTSLGNGLSVSELKTQASQITQVASTIAMVLLSKKVPGMRSIKGLYGLINCKNTSNYSYSYKLIFSEN